MSQIEKYQGIIPAFYACYDEAGAISPERVRALTEYFIQKGVKGLYVGGSSGECIYQSVEERKLVLENVMEANKGRVTIIAHVACNNTEDSKALAAHAESLGVDAIASIAPNTDFIIYNIPQLAGVALTLPLLREMKKNPKMVGVKNSSMPTQDIQLWRDEGVFVFNGPDEQLISGLVMGACGGIGGTYGAMPELFLKLWEKLNAGELEAAREIQNECCRIIYALCEHGNLYAIIKGVLKVRGVEVGNTRKPMPGLTAEDQPLVEKCVGMIDAAIAKFC